MSENSENEEPTIEEPFLTEGDKPTSTDSEEADTAKALAAFMNAEPEEPVAAEATEPEEAPITAEALFGPEEKSEEEAPPVIAEPEEPVVERVRVEEDDFEDDEDIPPLVREVPDDGIVRRWYAVHVHSGQEASVQKNLQTQAEQEGLDTQMPNVLVPMERVAEFKSGEKKVSQRKFFPGYILVQLPEHPERHADLWHLIKDTSGVTGFIGSRNEPVPLEDSEVAALIEEIRGERERPRAKVNFSLGERVKITEGAFANFTGNVNEINEDRGKLKVFIEIFERQTAVEVEFWQVEKL